MFKGIVLHFLESYFPKYSALSLSEVSPVNLSHDSVSRWLEETHIRPKDIWNEAKDHVLRSNGIIVADETVLNKSRSQKIKLVKMAVFRGRA